MAITPPLRRPECTRATRTCRAHRRCARVRQPSRSGDTPAASAGIASQEPAVTAHHARHGVKGSFAPSDASARGVKGPLPPSIGVKGPFTSLNGGPAHRKRPEACARAAIRGAARGGGGVGTGGLGGGGVAVDY